MVEEVANATNIGKLRVNEEWTKTCFIKKKFDKNKKTSKEKFEAFMTFLAEYKEMVEYQMSEARQASGGLKTQT